MKRKLISSVILALSILGGSFIGTGAANATPMWQVCQGIDEAPTYTAYLIDAFVWGKAFNWNSSAQADNIVDSIRVYCPWHLSGINAAASYLSNDDSYVS